MKNEALTDHRALAREVGKRIFEGPGETDPTLRKAVAACAAAGTAMQAPYDALARKIGEAAQETTDSDVAQVLAAAGTEKAAFELVLAASVAAGLFRWERALEALEGASDASAGS